MVLCDVNCLNLFRNFSGGICEGFDLMAYSLNFGRAKLVHHLLEFLLHFSFNHIHGINQHQHILVHCGHTFLHRWFSLSVLFLIRFSCHSTGFTFLTSSSLFFFVLLCFIGFIFTGIQFFCILGHHSGSPFSWYLFNELADRAAISVGICDTVTVVG